MQSNRGTTTSSVCFKIQNNPSIAFWAITLILGRRMAGDFNRNPGGGWVGGGGGILIGAKINYIYNEKDKTKLHFAIMIIISPAQQMHSIIRLKCTDVTRDTLTLNVYCLIKINSKLHTTNAIFDCQNRSIHRCITQHCQESTVIFICDHVGLSWCPTVRPPV